MSKNKPDNNSVKSPLYVFVFGLLKKQGIIFAISLIILLSVSIVLPTIWAQAITTIIGLYMYFELIYSYSWSAGERDRNLVMYNHIKADDLKGLKAGILSNIPIIILTFLVILQPYISVIPETTRFIFNAVTSPFILFSDIVYKANMTYLLILILPILPFISWLGYRHGNLLKEPTARLMYKNPNKKKYHSRNNKRDSGNNNDTNSINGKQPHSR